MKFCPNCGKQTDDAHPFCSGCGYKFPAAAPTNSAYAYQTPPTRPPVKTKKSKTPLIIVIAVVAVLAIAAALFFVTNIFGNHVMQVTEGRIYSDGVVSMKIEREFDSNGDWTKKTEYHYNDDGTLYAKRVFTYEYDGKHNMTAFTSKTTYSDGNSNEGETYKTSYEVKAYKEDGLWYYELYDEDGTLLATDVYDKHRELIQELEDGEIESETEYEYDFFGRILSERTTYESGYWYEITYEYDGNEMIGKYSDASDWDEDTGFYESYEEVYEWHFYYFW